MSVKLADYSYCNIVLRKHDFKPFHVSDCLSFPDSISCHQPGLIRDTALIEINSTLGNQHHIHTWQNLNSSTLTLGKVKESVYNSFMNQHHQAASQFQVSSNRQCIEQKLWKSSLMVLLIPYSNLRHRTRIYKEIIITQTFKWTCNFLITSST